MKALEGYIFVSVEKKLSDTIKYGTLELFIDPEFAPESHSPTFGTVEAIYDGINENIKVGSKVYFDFKSVGVNEKEFFIEGKTLYRVPLYFIFCVIVDGRIIMIGDRVFCNSIEVEGSVKEEEGMVRKSATGIIEEINLKHDLKRAVVAHMGETDLDVAIGDIIYYEEGADDEYEIEGKKYFVMRQDDLMAKEL